MNEHWTPASLDAVRAFLRGHHLIAGTEEPVRIGDGHSNLTFRFGDIVLRRPPPPPTPPGAHDVLREARILRALEGTGVPVPRVRAAAEAGSVLDVPFYVMDFIAGEVITDRLPPRMAESTDRRTMGLALVDSLVDLHAVDWRKAGLEGFGRPEGFNLRHVRRIDALMRSTVVDDPPAGFEPLVDWLAVHAPQESGAAIVHADYRLGNVIWSLAGKPRLLAILDWELATIGDPLLDVGYLAMCHPVHGEALTPTQELSAALLETGFPTRDEVLVRYAERSGRDLSLLSWYSALAAWKTGVLYEYSRRKGHDAYYADAGKPLRFFAAARRFAGLG